MKIARSERLPIASGGFRRRLFEALCLVLVAGCCLLLAWAQTRSHDLLELDAGAIIRSTTSEYDSWPAMALLDGDPDTGWASRKGHPAPNAIVVELPQRHRVKSIVLDNTRAQKHDFPGISARDVEIWVSTSSPDDGFRVAAVVEGVQGGRLEYPLPAGSEAQWIRLVITSNWGNRDFTELMELEAYGERLGPAAEMPLIIGTFQTNFGPLYLEQNGQLIRGCYDDGSARVTGTIGGRMLALQWRETPGFGSARLGVSADGAYLHGLWYQGPRLRGVWAGPRDFRDPEPLCAVETLAWPDE